MRLANARAAGREFVGLGVGGGRVLDLGAAARKAGEKFRELAGLASIEHALSKGDGALQLLQELAEEAARWEGSSAMVPESAVKLLAPVLHATKVLGIGLNYHDHCREQNIDPPKAPLVFAKFASSIIGPGDPITWGPDVTKEVDWEAELAFVVGRKAKDVPAREAESYIAGYCSANDVTARDLQRSERQWPRAKGMDTFCPLGPWLVTADEVGDTHDLAVRCRVNGATMQDSSTRNLIFDVPQLVAHLTKTFTLWPGDVVLTGTPAGVGTFRKPPIYLKDGDTVEVEVGGLGILRNPCRVLD